jgi:hypothetical protein
MIIDGNVLRFLEQHSALIYYLFEVFHEIDKYFPDAPIELSILEEYGGIPEKLEVGIITIMPPEKALEILNKFRNDWYLAHYEDLIVINLKWR